MSRMFFALAIVLLLVPAAGRAQEAFTPLESGLKVGQKVAVTADGRKEVVKGKITRLDEASIALHDGRLLHELRAADIWRIERPKDRIWNGVGYGFGVGFAAGFIAVMADPCHPGEWCILSGPSAAAGVGVLAGGVGAGIGALTDALTSDRRVVFERSTRSGTSASILPIVGHGRRGVRVSVRF
jgi:hypothetical protein